MGNLKRPNEFEELPLDTNYLFDESMYRYSTLLPQLKLIEQAKKDAWNAAIRWASENGKCKYDSIESHVSGEYCWDVNVNKQSILNGLIDD